MQHASHFNVLSLCFGLATPTAKVTLIKSVVFWWWITSDITKIKRSGRFAYFLISGNFTTGFKCGDFHSLIKMPEQVRQQLTSSASIQFACGRACAVCSHIDFTYKLKSIERATLPTAQSVSSSWLRPFMLRKLANSTAVMEASRRD